MLVPPVIPWNLAWQTKVITEPTLRGVTPSGEGVTTSCAIGYLFSLAFLPTPLVGRQGLKEDHGEKLP